MGPALDPAFLDRPIAHRALHDRASGRPENSRAAVRAAVEHGYGIEIDLQLSADGVAMVFHDHQLKRLTGAAGDIHDRTAAELAALPLIGGDEGVPTFAEVLDIVAGRVPLLVEVKDQDGAMGPAIGPLEHAVTEALSGYSGPVALMSYNPHSVAAMGAMAPHIARGLTTEAFPALSWPRLSATRRRELARMTELERTGASFVSHDATDLTTPHLAPVRDRGLPVLCWTIRSPAAEARARQHAHNVTFEGYLPA